MKKRCQQSLIVFFTLALLYAAQVAAKPTDFAGMNLNLAHDEVSLFLEGDMAFNFSKAALEALGNGLPLVVDTQIIFKPVGKWYWQKPLLSHTHKLEIQYHALSQQYLVKGIGNPYSRTFLTQASALAALGRVSNFTLIDLVLLDKGQQYEISIRSALDSESLPVPLRPLIYLSDDWRLASDWKRLPWPVKQ